MMSFIVIHTHHRYSHILYDERQNISKYFFIFVPFEDSNWICTRTHQIRSLLLLSSMNREIRKNFAHTYSQKMQVFRRCSFFSLAAYSIVCERGSRRIYCTQHHTHFSHFYHFICALCFRVSVLMFLSWKQNHHYTNIK